MKKSENSNVHAKIKQNLNRSCTVAMWKAGLFLKSLAPLLIVIKPKAEYRFRTTATLSKDLVFLEIYYHK
jgi:hypothetical protein